MFFKFLAATPSKEHLHLETRKCISFNYFSLFLLTKQPGSVVDLIMLSTLRIYRVDSIWVKRNVEYRGKDIDRGRLKY